MAAIPEDMAAIEIREPGPPDVLTPVRRPVPTPQAEEVLIGVAAAGVNRPDCLQRRGLYHRRPGRPTCRASRLRAPLSLSATM